MKKEPQIIDQSELYFGVNHDKKLANSKEIPLLAGSFALNPQYERSIIGKSLPVLCQRCGWRGLDSETLCYKLKLEGYPHGLNQACPFCWKHEELLRETLSDDQAEVI